MNGDGGRGRKRTFVMSQDATGNLQLCSWGVGWQVRGGRLEEEEGFLRNGVVEFLDVVEVVSADSDDLRWSAWVWRRERDQLPFYRA